MGSGKVLKDKMRNRSSEFVKNILVIVDSRDEAARIERELVGPEQLADPLCLNVILGGDKGVGGIKRPDLAAQNRTRAGRKLTEEHKQKLRDAKVGWVSNRKGTKLSEEQKAKISASLTGRKRGPYNMKNGHKIAEANRRRVKKNKDD